MIAQPVAETIVRLHRSGFPAARIAQLVHVSPSTVRSYLPSDARDEVELDLSFLPTSAMRSLARRVIAERIRGPAPTGARVPWLDGELKLLRLCVAEGYTLAQIAEAISRLGVPRSSDSVGIAARTNGIKVNSRGKRKTKTEVEA